MAKNKISVDLEVDDKGSLKKVSNSANKTSQSLDKVAKGSSTTDRNLKGVAGASSNATKNFSKMSQGMGGVLGAYANLAASLFAISAAFNFLKSAGDLKVLEQGQILYAAKTGVAMGALAKDIIAATDAQITFSDASQAAAIGLAAGLSQQQLKELGKAAKDTSLILGRDVTDSFNRLVRGVTKAEPELLDELGIILRLNDANEKYAAKLGKSANSLTQFEKSQAVANDVLDQARTKFSDIIGDDTEVNVYNQLAKSFDDLIIKVKEVVDVIAEPFAKAITKTPLLGVAALGLLVKGPLEALGVNFGEMTIKSKEAWKSQREYYTDLKTQAAAASISVQGATDKLKTQAAQITSLGSKSAILNKLGTGGILKGPDTANLKKALKAAELEYKNSGEITKGIFKGVDIAIVRDFKLAMNEMSVAQEGLVTKTKIVTTRLKLYWNTVKLGLQGLKTAAITAGAFMLNAFGWISMAITLFTVLADYMGWFNKEQSKAEKAAEALTEKLKGLNEQWTKFYETQRKLMASGNTSTTIIGIGNQLQSLSMEENITSLNKYLALKDEQIRLEKEAKLQGFDLNSDKKWYEQDVFSTMGGDTKDYSLSAQTNAIKRQKEISETLEKELKQYEDMIPLLQTRLMLTDGADQSAANLLKVLTVGGTKEEMEKAFLAEQNLGMALTAANEAAKAATQSIGSFYGALNKNNGADAALSDIDNHFISMEQKATNLGQAFEKGISPLENWKNLVSKFDGNLQAFGLDPEEQARIKAYIKQADTITKINQTRHEFEKEGIKLAAEREEKYRTALRYEKDFMKAKDAVEDSERSIARIVQDRLDILSGAGVDTEEKLEGAAKRAYEIATENLALENQVLLTAEQRKKIEEDMLPIARQLQQIRLDTEVMSQAKEYLGVLNQQVSTQKESINAQQTIAKLRMQRVERDIQRSNPFAFLREEERVAEATYQLELSMVGTKITQINNEFDIKRQMIAMEHVLLDAKLRVSELELKNRAAAVDLDEEQRQALQALAAATASQRALISQNLGGQFQLLDAQQQAAIEGIIDELDKLDFARQNLSDMAVITDTIVRDLHSGLSNVFSDLITNKVSSFKTAMLKAVQGIAESLARTLSDMFARNIIEGVQGFLFGKQNNPILGAAQQGSLKVASTLKNGAAAVANAIRAAFTEGAARIAAQKEDNISKALSAFVGPPEKEKETSNDFFQNVFGTLGSQRPAPSGVPSIKAEQPATAAQKLGSMFGKSSATFVNAQPTQPTQGMFSGLMKFMGNIFSMDNPLIKGFQAIFSKSNPLLQGLGGLFGKLFSGLGSILGGGASGISSLIGGFFGFANGGMVKGGFRAYANGGIATKPTIGLVGEGKYNEAIVPMPNGKAIPVDMKGSQGQNNNITINIDSTGGATTSGMSDQDNKQLGKAIAQAVQRELQNQKRSGGILSPYGVS